MGLQGGAPGFWGRGTHRSAFLSSVLVPLGANHGGWGKWGCPTHNAHDDLGLIVPTVPQPPNPTPCICANKYENASSTGRGWGGFCLLCLLPCPQSLEQCLARQALHQFV